MSLTTEQAKELLDRMRRIETRVTGFLQAQGHDVQTQQPTWTYGTVHVPSRGTPLASILNVIPSDYSRRFGISLKIGDDLIGHLYLGGD